MDLGKIKEGTKVTYPFFSNIVFAGTDDRHVILKDAEGNTKKVFKELFVKYGKVENN